MGTDEEEETTMPCMTCVGMEARRDWDRDESWVSSRYSPLTSTHCVYHALPYVQRIPPLHGDVPEWPEEKRGDETLDLERERFVEELRKLVGHGRDSSRDGIDIVQCHRVLILVRTLRGFDYKLDVADLMLTLEYLIPSLYAPEISSSLRSKIANTLVFILSSNKWQLLDAGFKMQWRPLFDFMRPWIWILPPTENSLQLGSSSLQSSLASLLCQARYFFPPSTGRDILDELRPLFYEIDCDFQAAMTYLAHSLPPNIENCEAVIDELMDVWSWGGSSLLLDVCMFMILNTIVRSTLGIVDWSKYLDMCLTRLLAVLGLAVGKIPPAAVHADVDPGLRVFLSPRGLTNKAIRYACGFLTSLVTPLENDPTFHCLERFLVSVEMFYHPSSQVATTSYLMSLLDGLCLFMNDRLHDERKNEVPYGREFFLGRREKDRFVRMLLPVLEKAMFSTSSDLRKFAQLGYKYLSHISPNLAISSFEASTHGSFDAISEPHRFLAAFNVIGMMYRSFCVGPGAAQRLLDVLPKTVDAISVNDLTKMNSVTRFLVGLSQCVPFMAYDAEHEDFLKLPLEEQTALLQLGSLWEEWSFETFKRWISVARNSTPRSSNDAFFGQRALSAFSGLLWAIPDDFGSPFSRILFENFSSPIGSDHLGVLTTILSGFTHRFAAPALALFVPHAADLLLHIEDDSNLSSSETQWRWHLHALRALTIKAGSAIIPYIATLRDIIKASFKSEHSSVHKDAAVLLRTLLRCLSATYSMDHFSFPRQLRESDDFLRASWKYWGMTFTFENADLEWHIPTAREISATHKLVKEFVDFAKDSLEQLISLAQGSKNGEPSVSIRAQARRNATPALLILEAVFSGAALCIPEITASGTSSSSYPKKTEKSSSTSLTLNSNIEEDDDIFNNEHEEDGDEISDGDDDFEEETDDFEDSDDEGIESTADGVDEVYRLYFSVGVEGLTWNSDPLMRKFLSDLRSSISDLLVRIFRVLHEPLSDYFEFWKFYLQVIQKLVIFRGGSLRELQSIVELNSGTKNTHYDVYYPSLRYHRADLCDFVREAHLTRLVKLTKFLISPCKEWNQLIDVTFELCLDEYSLVRKLAQSVLGSILSPLPGRCARRLIPRILDTIADSLKPECARKGAAFVLRVGSIVRRLTLHFPLVVYAMFALLCTTDIEKASLSRAVNGSAMYVFGVPSIPLSAIASSRCVSSGHVLTIEEAIVAERKWKHVISFLMDLVEFSPARRSTEEYVEMIGIRHHGVLRWMNLLVEKAQNHDPSVRHWHFESAVLSCLLCLRSIALNGLRLSSRAIAYLAKTSASDIYMLRRIATSVLGYVLFDFLHSPFLSIVDAPVLEPQEDSIDHQIKKFSRPIRSEEEWKSTLFMDRNSFGFYCYPRKCMVLVYDEDMTSALQESTDYLLVPEFLRQNVPFYSPPQYLKDIRDIADVILNLFASDQMPPSPLSLRRGSIPLRSSELDMDSTMVWTSSPSSFSPLADHRFSDASVLNHASIIQQSSEPVGSEPCTPVRSLEISTTLPSTKPFSYLHTLLEMMQIEPGNRQASFSVSHMSLWKSIARIVGYPAWECLYPLIISFPDIAGESVPEEPSRICCLCEIVSGFSRGSRDWSYAQQQIWSEQAVRLLKPTISNCSFRCSDYVSECIRNCSYDRDPRRLYWIQDFLLENLDLEDTSKSSQVPLKWLLCLQSLVGELCWRNPPFLYDVLDRLSPHVSHPSKQIRASIVEVFYIIARNLWRPALYSTARRASFAHSANILNEKFNDFLSSWTSYLSQIDLAAAASVIAQSHSRRVNESNEQESSSTEPSIDLSHLEESMRIIRSTKSLLQFTKSLTADRRTRMNFQYVIQLLPIVFDLQHISDEEVRTLSQSVLINIASCSFSSSTAVPSPSDGKNLVKVNFIDDSIALASRMLTSRNKNITWIYRLGVLQLLQPLVFRNRFIMSADSWSMFFDSLIDALSDDSVEVREEASITLSGYISVLESDGLLDMWMDRFWSLSETPLRMIGRKIDLTDPNMPTLILRRQSGILGLGAIIRAHPHDVREYTPRLLVRVASHINDPEPVSSSVRRVLTDFWKTHRDMWVEHKKQFSEEQLDVLNELMLAPSYYC